MENNQISKFYKKCFMRIYPSYLLVVLIFNVINNNFILNYELLAIYLKKIINKVLFNYNQKLKKKGLV